MSGRLVQFLISQLNISACKNKECIIREEKRVKKVKNQQKNLGT